MINQTLSALKKKQAELSDPRLMCQPSNEGDKDSRYQELIECIKFKELQDLSPENRIRKLIHEKGAAFASVYNRLSRRYSSKARFVAELTISKDGEIEKIKISRVSPSYQEVPWIKKLVDKTKEILKKIDFRYANLPYPIIIEHPFKFEPGY